MGLGNLLQFLLREAIRRQANKVVWYNVVWFKGFVPRLAVILWMAYRRKMLTKDKLLAWGSVQENRCVLCDKAIESINHLFFVCPFPNAIWKEVLRQNNVHREVGNWESESSTAIGETKGSDFVAKIRALSLAAAVYLIWKERNHRIFRQCRKSWQHTLSKVEELVREATWNWRSKRTYTNWLLCKEWDLKETVMLV